jgi:N-acetylneuraminic acid mutarotase
VVVLGGSAGNAVLAGRPGAALRSIGALPSRRAGGAAFLNGGAVYFVGGEDATATPSDEILEVNPATGEVTSAGRFVEPLAGAGYVQSGDSLVLVGGWTGEQYATAVLRFTLPDTADVVARLPEATRDAAVTVRGDTLYVAGGRTESGLSDAVYAVDLGAGTVSVVGRLPHAVAGAALVPAGGKLYLIGGKDAAGPVRTIVSIDPATGTIGNAGTMPRPLAGAAVVRAGGATYLIGGTRPTSVTRLDTG